VNAVVGRRLSLAPSGPDFTVAGVVGDVREHDLGTAPAPTVYMAQAVPVNRATELSARRLMALVVRTAEPAPSGVAAIRGVVRELDPTIPIFGVEPMSDIVRASTARLSFTLALMSAAAGITLVLGTIGLYGVMTYMVSLRTREFGIRLALGADPQVLARGVATRGMVLLASGIAGGFLVYAIAAPLLRGFLCGVTATDPATLGGATAVVVVTAAIASWLPAKRASRVDPMVALRNE
jgi:hypothetical protein